MGVAPLLIILLCLPFIKAFDSFETGVDTVDSGGHSFDGVDTGGHSVDTVDFGHTDAVHPDSIDTDVHDISDAPGVHHTHDYFRTGPDGEMQHVHGYEATNPDGILENNYSYQGESHADSTVPSDAASLHGTDGPVADSPADTSLLAGTEGALEKERREQRKKELSLDDAIRHNRKDR